MADGNQNKLYVTLVATGLLFVFFVFMNSWMKKQLNEEETVALPVPITTSPQIIEQSDGPVGVPVIDPNNDPLAPVQQSTTTLSIKESRPSENENIQPTYEFPEKTGPLAF